MAVLAPVDHKDEVFAGEHKVLRWTVTNKRGVAIGLPGWVNLSLTFRPHNDEQAAALLALTPIVSDAVGGIIVAPLTAAHTLALGAGVHDYVLARTDVGAEQVVAYGPFVIRPRRV